MEQHLGDGRPGSVGAGPRPSGRCGHPASGIGPRVASTAQPTGDRPMAALSGQMMQMPLMISSLIVHAARHAAQTEIVSKRVEGDLHRYTWADAEQRARKVAQALARLGCAASDRVGTLA